MRTLKRDKLVLKALQSKNITVEDAILLSEQELLDLKLPKIIRDAIGEYKLRGGMTADEVANKIADIMEQPITEVEPEVVSEYNVDTAEPLVIEVKEEPVVEEIEVKLVLPPSELDDIAETVVSEYTEVDEVSREELEAIASEYNTVKSIATLTKKMQKEIGDRTVDFDVLSDVIKTQVKLNKKK